jgi:hypothetical protein
VIKKLLWAACPCIVSFFYGAAISTKLTGYLTWPWWVIFAPLAAGAALFGPMILFAYFFVRAQGPPPWAKWG